MKKLVVLLSLLFVTLVSTHGFANQEMIIAGAGPSTKVVQLFFDMFAQQPEGKGYTFSVPPNSIKHAGGLRSTEKNLFGRTGRPLTASEQASGKVELFLAKVPIAFAVGTENPVSSLSLKQIEKIFTGEISNWKALGGPDQKIVTVGREPSEALFSELKQQYPFFQKAQFEVVLKKDHDVVNFLKSPAGNLAIAFGAAPNFSEVKMLAVEGDFDAGVRLGLVYDQKNAADPMVAAVKKFAGSSTWKNSVRKADLLPAL